MTITVRWIPLFAALLLALGCPTGRLAVDDDAPPFGCGLDLECDAVVAYCSVTVLGVPGGGNAYLCVHPPAGPAFTRNSLPLDQLHKPRPAPEPPNDPGLRGGSDHHLHGPPGRRQPLDDLV